MVWRHVGGALPPGSDSDSGSTNAGNASLEATVIEGSANPAGGDSSKEPGCQNTFTASITVQSRPICFTIQYSDFVIGPLLSSNSFNHWVSTKLEQNPCKRSLRGEHNHTGGRVFPGMLHRSRDSTFLGDLSMQYVIQHPALGAGNLYVRATLPTQCLAFLVVHTSSLSNVTCQPCIYERVLVGVSGYDPSP